MPDPITMYGTLTEKPMVFVTGTFTIPNLLTAIKNTFEFSIDLNNGAISNSYVELDYKDTGNYDIKVVLYGGSGLFTNNSFDLYTTQGSISGSYGYNAPQGHLHGTLNSNNPAPGALVLTGALDLTAGSAPVYIPSVVPIAGGQVSDMLPPASQLEERKGHFIGSFFPAFTEMIRNYFVFDLDFATGLITNADISLHYYRPHGIPSEVLSTYSASGGTGHLNLKTMAFYISNFPLDSHNRYSENNDVSGGSGRLGPGTNITGSFMPGPIGYGVSDNVANLTPDYSVVFNTPLEPMPTLIPLHGTIDRINLVQMNGSMDIPFVSGIPMTNYYRLTLNLNNGQILDSMIVMDFYHTLSPYGIYIRQDSGTGSLVGNSFTVTGTRGIINATDGYSANIVSSTLTGTLTSSNPSLGTTVSPGGSYTITPSVPLPAYLTTPFGIKDGQIDPAQTLY
jgi:hypothetical protein